MPIYEYECQKCGAHTEVMQKVSDKPLKKCRKCGGKLEKKWSLTGFQFKGEGWYVTDYAGKKSEAKEETKAETKSEEKSTTETAEKTETKSETKSESKKETKKSKTKKPSART